MSGASEAMAARPRGREGHQHPSLVARHARALDEPVALHPRQDARQARRDDLARARELVLLGPALFAEHPQDPPLLLRQPEVADDRPEEGEQGLERLPDEARQVGMLERVALLAVPRRHHASLSAVHERFPSRTGTVKILIN